MAAFVFGTPMQMMTSQKPTLKLFGGAYLFSVEGTTQTGAFRFVSATIMPDPKIKVLPETLDKIPTILDVYEYCDNTSIVEFLLSILFDGAIDPYYTSKEVHIRDDRGMIFIRARIIPDLMCPQPVDASNSYTIQKFVQRLGNLEFMITGQEYDFPSEPTQMATVTVAHSPLSIRDNWHGFNSPLIDWISVYKEFILDMEFSLHQGGMVTYSNEDTISKYVKYISIFETSVTADQLSVRIVQYPRTMMGVDVAFPAGDPNAILLKVPNNENDGVDPLLYWRQIIGNLYPGIIPLLLTCTGTVVQNGDNYLYIKLDSESNGISNAWAFHQYHSVRPNAMMLFPNAGETNTIDMTIRIANDGEYSFSASFYPFIEEAKSIAILNSGNEEFPYVIGILECEFVADLLDMNFLTSIMIDPAGSFLSKEFVSQINQWMGLPKDETWMMFNYVARPNHRFFQVAVKHRPYGMTTERPNFLPEQKPASNELKRFEKKKRWKFW